MGAENADSENYPHAACFHITTTNFTHLKQILTTGHRYSTRQKVSHESVAQSTRAPPLSLLALAFSEIAIYRRNLRFRGLHHEAGHESGQNSAAIAAELRS
jgi:hypothetical protein